MLKGINKNVIVMHPPRASRFDAVYFVVKRADADDSDLADEANRIIREAEYVGSRRRGGRALFLWGLLCGSAVPFVFFLVSLIVR